MLTSKHGLPTLMLVSLLLAMLGLSGEGTLAQGDARPLQVAVTIPDLGSLVREIGGDQVSVTTFAKGTEAPHFVEAKPSFIKTLSEADLFVEMAMEMGWVPVLLQNASNATVLAGARGFLDASTAIAPMDPSGPLDRSMGMVGALPRTNDYIAMYRLRCPTAGRGAPQSGMNLGGDFASAHLMSVCTASRAGWSHHGTPPPPRSVSELSGVWT